MDSVGWRVVVLLHRLARWVEWVRQSGARRRAVLALWSLAVLPQFGALRAWAQRALTLQW